MTVGRKYDNSETLFVILILKHTLWTLMMCVSMKDRT